ncbi:hypothetical protein CPB85DRAFT_1447795 [Mucidula mucida]|nr:hypothetical protein CPB85DRAFT_1447795 [Mucidula mucida]
MLLPIIPPLVVAADSTAIEFPTRQATVGTLPTTTIILLTDYTVLLDVGHQRSLPRRARRRSTLRRWGLGLRLLVSYVVLRHYITPLIFSDADVVLSDVLLWLCAQHQYFSLASPLRRDVPEAMFDWSRCFHASRKLASKAKACIPVNPFWSTPALDVPSRHEGALSHDAAGGGDLDINRYTYWITTTVIRAIRSTMLHIPSTTSIFTLLDHCSEQNERTMSPRLMPVFAFTMKPRIVHLAAHPWPEFGLATCRPTLLPIQHGIGPYSRLYGCDDGVDGLPLPD